MYVTDVGNFDKCDYQNSLLFSLTFTLKRDTFVRYDVLNLHPHEDKRHNK